MKYGNAWQVTSHRSYSVQTFMTTFTHSVFATLNCCVKYRASTDVWGIVTRENVCLYAQELKSLVLLNWFPNQVKEKVKTIFEEKKKEEYDMGGESWSRLIIQLTVTYQIRLKKTLPNSS